MQKSITGCLFLLEEDRKIVALIAVLLMVGVVFAFMVIFTAQ